MGVAGDILDRTFAPTTPNKVWVTDITYIRTYKGWLLLAAVMDLYSRQVSAWAMRPTMSADPALQAMLAVVRKRKPAPDVLVHSDQGSQFTSGTGVYSSRPIT